MYFVDNFPNHLVLRFLKSRSHCTHKRFSGGKNVLHNFRRWLQSVLAMYIVLARYIYINTVITLAALTHKPEVKV